jgi:hypothetical protein
MASVTTLYHLHTCFNLQRSVIAALSSAGVSDKAVGLASEEWWVGRGILLAFSMGLQKIPMTVLNSLLRIEEIARKKAATHGHERGAWCWSSQGGLRVPRWYPAVPWSFWGIAVAGSFTFVVLLTSKVGHSLERR